MKFLHTADWHLGKFVNGVSMLEDQEFFLKELINFMKKRNIKIVLVSGDIFDRSIPPVEAIRLFDWFLNQLVKEEIKGLFITGNHDSAKRLSFGQAFLENKDIYLESLYRDEIKKVTLKEADEETCFYLLPYLEYQNVKTRLEETVSNQSEGYKAYMEHNRELIDEKAVNVLLAHGFFAYSKTPPTITNSELRVGPSELVNAYFFDWFDYVALGHIHASQTVGKEAYRYAGSILKYSVDETKQNKSVTLVEVTPEKSVKISTAKIPVLRDFVTLKGTMSQLENKELPIGNVSDYVFADITEDTLVYGAMQRLRKVYPNILGLRFIKHQNTGEKKENEAGEIKKLSTEEMFHKFYFDMTGEEISKERSEIVRKTIEKEEGENAAQ